MSIDAFFVKDIKSLEELCDRLNSPEDDSLHRLENFFYTDKSDKLYKPCTSFTIAHDTENLYVKFFVSEEVARAKYTVSQGDPVWKDSCVEFFVKKPNDLVIHNHCSSI